jgi:hypothetical protein
LKNKGGKFGQQYFNEHCCTPKNLKKFIQTLLMQTLTRQMEQLLCKMTAMATAIT